MSRRIFCPRTKHVLNCKSVSRKTSLKDSFSTQEFKGHRQTQLDYTWREHFQNRKFVPPPLPAQDQTDSGWQCHIIKDKRSAARQERIRLNAFSRDPLESTRLLRTQWQCGCQQHIAKTLKQQGWISAGPCKARSSLRLRTAFSRCNFQQPKSVLPTDVDHSLWFSRLKGRPHRATRQ